MVGLPPPPPPPGWGSPPPPQPPPYGYPTDRPVGYAPPPAGYHAGPPPGWGFVSPLHATRLGLEPASFGARLGANLLDGLILLALSVPLFLLGLLIVVPGWETEPGTCTDSRGFEYACDVPTGGAILRIAAAIVLCGALALVASIFYWGKFEGERGQSPGKKALGIRVVHQHTGRPIGFGRAVGRMFARYLSSQVLYLGYLWMLWDDNKQTWHDKIVSSIVVKA
jgi:uncharacterized RDD family membrane protein YckC